MKTASLATQESNDRERDSSPAALSRTTIRRRSTLVLSAAFVIALLALLTSCSSDSNKPADTAKPEPKGPELITARSAFQKVYVAARGWNQDAKPYRLEATVTSDGNGRDGKWAVWRGSFASAAQRSEKSYTWSGSAVDGAPSRGVNPG